MIIRQADAADVDAIVKIEKLCFSQPWSHQAMYEELTQNKLAFYLVGEIEGQVAGYAGLWWVVDEGHITNVAVRPEFRKRGIAKGIIQLLLDFTEKEGIMSHTLEVRRSNEAAKHLYANFGFTEEGVRKGYYQDDNEDAIIMWRKTENKK